MSKIKSKRAWSLARARAPAYEQKLFAAVKLAKSRATRSHALVQWYLSNGTVVGIALDVPMECSFYILESGPGGCFGFMWEYMDSVSVNDLAKELSRQVRAYIAELGLYSN